MFAVIELLGKSLESQLHDCGGKFTVPTTLLIADQAIQRIEYLHSKSIIHRDIKPENFMCGVRQKVHHLYLIDFGLSKKYFSGGHVQRGASVNFAGTACYVSINTHKGLEQSRRDDLEAIGHMLMYFLRGSLPWSGLQGINMEEKYKRIRKTKELVSLEDLCGGFPDAFHVFLRAARDMKFKERPHYVALRRLFVDLRAQEDPPLEDHDLQWLQGQDLGVLVPLTPRVPVHQPDDAFFKRRCSFLRCRRKQEEDS